jgi:regulator of sirC expression with transglutaminase-like and TPR domain
MISQKKLRIQALITLLDDPDPGIFDVIEKELLKESVSVIPELEVMWETTPHEICQIRIEYLIHRILFKENFRKLRRWSRQQAPDLLEGFILASQYNFPDINVDRIYRRIEEIRKRVWVELNNSLTSLEKITVLNHVLFNEYGFTIVPDIQPALKYYSVAHILENRTGCAVAIALLYNIIARKLDLSVSYVDFPRNPMLAYVDRRIAAKVHPPEVDTDVLFYINPANNGSITGRRELEYVLRKMNVEESVSHTEASSPCNFLARLLEVTEKSYEMSDQPEKSADILQMIAVLSTKKSEKQP